MTISNQEAKQKVDDLIDLGMSNFSSWEIDFLTDQIDREEFTDGQLEKIEELWRKHCGN